MTAKELFSSFYAVRNISIVQAFFNDYERIPEDATEEGRDAWTCATRSENEPPQLRYCASSRKGAQEYIRYWWQTLSEHEKLHITEVPLPLLDAASSDWTKTQNYFRP